MISTWIKQLQDVYYIFKSKARFQFYTSAKIQSYLLYRAYDTSKNKGQIDIENILLWHIPNKYS